MSFEDHILIERFLKNELSKEERILFMQRIEVDQDFYKKVILEQQLYTTLDDKNWSYAGNKDHSEIKKYEAILKNEETKKIKAVIIEAQEIAKKSDYALKSKDSGNKLTRLRWIASIAALFMISFSIFWYFNAEKIDHKKVLENAWNKNVGLDFVVRNNNTDGDLETLIDALRMYEDKQYDEVLIALKKYDSVNKHYEKILLLRALSKNKLNQTDLALKTLDTLENYNSDISKWYKGLIYLEAGDLEKAKTYIEIPNETNTEIKFKK